MKINMRNGLPIVSITVVYQDKSIVLNDVLLDTGCAVSVFDTDIVEQVGLFIDRNSGRAVRMYGVGGQSELSFQQNVANISINDVSLDDFTLQLGMTKIPYGFDAILGADFCERAGIIIDFNQLLVRS
jgi:predicted aspartyl protease